MALAKSSTFVHKGRERMKIYLNGEFVDKADAKVSVFDHGLLYGDGVFEGIRLYDGCVFKLEEHLERLEFSVRSYRCEEILNRNIGNPQIMILSSLTTCRVIRGYPNLSTP